MHYAAIDVSQKECSIHVLDQEGRRVWRGTVETDPDVLVETLRRRAPELVKVGIETGTLATWLYHALSVAGLPVVCIDARRAQAWLSAAKANKTDRNDAEGLAQLVRAGVYAEVRVKSWGAMRVRTLMAARGQLTGIATKLGNEIRGHLKTFGMPLGKGGGRIFEREAMEVLRVRRDLRPLIEPLLAVWRAARARVAELDKLVLRSVRDDERCRLLTRIPGVGPVVALSFAAAVEDPAAFRNARAVGAWLGLTPTRYQSGATDVQGHISKRGDCHLRALLYQSALVLLTRGKAERMDCAIRRWGLALKEKVGHKRAVVAVARKLAVVMHAMLATGEAFRAGIDPVKAAA